MKHNHKIFGTLRCTSSFEIPFGAWINVCCSVWWKNSRWDFRFLLSCDFLENNSSTSLDSVFRTDIQFLPGSDKPLLRGSVTKRFGKKSQFSSRPVTDASKVCQLKYGGSTRSSHAIVVVAYSFSVHVVDANSQRSNTSSFVLHRHKLSPESSRAQLCLQRSAACFAKSQRGFSHCVQFAIARTFSFR